MAQDDDGFNQNGVEAVGVNIDRAHTSLWLTVPDFSCCCNSLARLGSLGEVKGDQKRIRTPPPPTRALRQQLIMRHADFPSVVAER